MQIAIRNTHSKLTLFLVNSCEARQVARGTLLIYVNKVNQATNQPKLTYTNKTRIIPLGGSFSNVQHNVAITLDG